MDEPLIRIFLIEDDHAVIFPGLNNRFRPSRDRIDFVDCAGSIDDALRKAIPEGFDLFFLDLYLPGTDPVANISALRRAFPEKPIIIYSTEQNPSWYRKTMEAGAHAYLTKKDSRSVIKDTILMVMDGKLVFPTVGNREELGRKNVTITGHDARLLPLESEILRLLIHGHTQKEIGTALAIGKNKVEKMLQKLRRVYKVKNNVQLIHTLSIRGII
jgi:two-component system response regulator FimZ (fimbrial Z protein)